MPTFAQLQAKFPNASLGFLAANASDGLPPDLCPRRPVIATTSTKTPTAAKTPKKRLSRVPRTRNAGTWTEAEYWGRIRSCLRRLSRFWKPAVVALHAARIPCSGARGQKWSYICADCKKAFPRKQVNVDHVEPCGALTDLSHLPDFVRRLTPEDTNAYAVRCLSCHQVKTNVERGLTSAACP